MFSKYKDEIREMVCRADCHTENTQIVCFCHRYFNAEKLLERKEEQMVKRALNWLDVELSAGDLKKSDKERLLELFENELRK